MAQYRCQVTRWSPDAPTRDGVVNTFYLDTDASILGPGDASDLADDINALFASPASLWQGGRITTRLYNMSDAEPREPVADEELTTGATSPGPREVALCLSYYADRNLPRRRGRLFMGPWNSSGSIFTERPDSTLRGQLATLAEGLSGLGGINVQWVQYSPTTGDFSNVTDYFIDDEWDTIRSRGLRATTRTTGTVSG